MKFRVLRKREQRQRKAAIAETTASMSQPTHKAARPTLPSRRDDEHQPTHDLTTKLIV